jgi:wyosine [tRNA(Phe)-imidazoG37] synthetase (radical SAM superfamily)
MNMSVERQVFYRPKDIFREVRAKVDEATSRNEKIDYLTFVPDGEPTLDINLRKEISLMKQIGIPIVVLTNASILQREDVRGDLSEANFVSLKVDAVTEDIWRNINRPHKDLELDRVLEGIADFATIFKGEIVTETMLVNCNNYGVEFERIAEFLRHLKKLDKAYVAIPTRPPTEKWVERPVEEVINAAFQAFIRELGPKRVEYLIGYEGNAFAFTGSAEDDLLAITAVHPMRKEAVQKFLRKANADWQIIEKLLRENKIIELDYEGNTYYMRKLPSKSVNSVKPKL